MLTKFLEKDYEVNENVLIFDFHNLVHRNIFMADFNYPDDDEYIYWKFLMINGMFNAIKQHKATKVIIALEGSKNWRKDYFTEYKAQRRAERKKSTIDFDKFYKVFDVFVEDLKKAFTNFYFLRIDEAEADDIIAILTKNSLLSSTEIVLISTDKDFIQLLDYKNFKIYNPIKKQFVQSINPKQDLQLKILMGDKSDNVPAIKPKTGIKTAEKMLANGLSDLLDDPLNIELKENYERNKNLIDFNFIPLSVKSKIINVYETTKVKKYNINTVWNFMIRNKIKKFTDELNQWTSTLKKVGNNNGD